MDFPAKCPEPRATLGELPETLGIAEAGVLKTDDYLVVIDDGRTVAALVPDFARLKGLPCRGVAVTAHNQRFDFILY